MTVCGQSNLGLLDFSLQRVVNCLNEHEIQSKNNARVSEENQWQSNTKDHVNSELEDSQPPWSMNSASSCALTLVARLLSL